MHSDTSRGVDTTENNEIGERAIEQYKKVIDVAPPKTDILNAVKGVAYMYLQMRKFDDAKEYYRRATALEPTDPEPYYSIGVIDWTEIYQLRQEERAKLGMRPADALPEEDHALCATLREKNSGKIEDGIDNFNKALELRPDYDDAMAYMNLMYRERTDVQCDDPGAREADLQSADDWVDKTMATKKAKATKADRQPAFSTTKQ